MFAECEVEKWYEVLNFPQDGACGSLDVGIEKSKKKKKDSLLSERKDAALCRDSEYAEAKKKERGGIFRFFRWLRRNRSSKTSAGAGASCTRSTMHVSELGRGKTKSLESVTSLSQSFHYIPVGVRCSEDPAGMESRECVYEDLDPGMQLTPRPVASKLKCSSLSRVNCDELEKQKRGAVYEVHRPRSVRSACSPNLANSSFSRKKRRAPLPPALGTPAGRRSAGSSRNHWIKVLPGTSTETTGSTSRLSNGDVALSHLGDVNRKIASSTGAIYRDPSKILEKAGHKPLEFVSPSMHKRSSSLTVSEAPKVPSSPQCVGSHIKNKRKAPPPPSPKPSEPLLKPSKGIQTEPLNVQPADQVVQKNDAAEMVRLSSDNFTEHHRDESVVVNGMESNAKVEISNGGDGKTHEVLTVKDHPQVDKETPQDVAAKNDVVEEVKVEAEVTKADEDTPPELPKKQNRGKIFQPLTLIVDEVQRLEPRRVEHKIDADLGIPEAAEMSIGCSDSTAELCAPSISKSSTVVHEAIMPPPTEVENVNDVVQSTEQPLKKPGRKSSKVSSSSDSSPVIAQLKILCIDEDENRPKAEAEMNIQALQELVETLVDQYCDNGKYSDPIAVKNLTLEKSNDNGEEPEAALPRRQEEDLSEAAHQRYDSATRRSLSVSSGASSGWLLDEKISNLDAENAMSTTYSTMNSSTTNTTTSASDAGEDAENDDQLAGQLLERWQARMREQMINMDFNLPEKQRQSKKVVVPPPLQSQSVGEEENNGGIYEPIGNFMLHPSGSNSRAVLGESVSEGGTWKRNSLAEEQSSLRDSGEDGLQGGAEGGSGRIEGKRNFGFQATFSNTEDPDDSEIKDPFLFWRDLCARKYSDGGGDQPQAAEKLIRRLSVNGQRQPVKKADQEQCCNPESGVSKDRIVPIAACAKSLKEAKLTRESSFQSGRQMPFQIYENVFTATPHRMVVVDGISVPNQYENCIPAVAPYWAVPPAAAGPIMPYGPALQRRYAAPHYQALTVMPFMAPPMPAIYADPRFHPGGYLTPAFGNYIYSAPHGNAAVKQEVRNKSRQAEKCGAGRTPTDFLRDSPLQETSSPEESEDGCALSNLQHSDVSVAAAASAEACLADGSDRENADEHSSVQDSSDPGDVDKLAVDRLLKQLEIAIGTGKLDEAAILARDLAQLKIQCLVVRNRTPAGDGQELPIILNMFVEDKVSHHGPIPIRVLPSITVGELKTKIFHEFEFPTIIQRWILGRQLASDDKLPISSFEVNSDGCPVFLYLLSLEDMRVKAKDLVWDDDISLKNTGAQAKKSEFPAKTTRAKKNIIKKIRQPMVQEQSFKTLESNAEISNTRLLGWSCANCTLVNIPTRPGCAMCGNERPTDYVVPEQYKLRESELERLEREKEQERAMIEAEELQRLQNWQHYLKLEDQDVIYNEVAFECSICFIETAPGQGVKLRDCLHSFCCECLRHAVTHSEAATVICPFRDDNYSCDSVLQEREIRALVPPDMFERYLQRSMKTAESQAPNSFHCKTPDCQGWCLIEDNANEFFCPVCSRLNCITCRAIHQELNCRQYQDKLMVLARTDDEAKKTKDAIDVMLRKGEAMNCPNCKVIIMKKWGCDWLCCSVCKTEICWVTKGPRWGPNGRGDLSAGCKCGTNGVRCHPNCTYCH